MCQDVTEMKTAVIFLQPLKMQVKILISSVSYDIVPNINFWEVILYAFGMFFVALLTKLSFNRDVSAVV